MIVGVRRWPGWLEPLWWAVRALRAELWGFRFQYPVEAVVAPGGEDSLHYHVFSEQLFFDAMELDADGVPVQHGRTFGDAYNPAYVAWYGLMRLERAVRGEDPSGRGAFLTQATWLAAHAVRRPDGGVVWHYPFDYVEGAGGLPAPWISAMSQGLAMSALIRAYRLTQDGRFRDLARDASVVFEQDITAGGVRTVNDGCVLYEEYPCIPPARVLDGFVFSLFGLYDVFAETRDRGVYQLFQDGVDGLMRWLPVWNYEDRWSWYGHRFYLSPPKYHALHRAQFTALAHLSGEPMLDQYARAWDPDRLTLPERAEVFVVFVITKNWGRLIHHLRVRRVLARAKAGTVAG